MIVGWHGTLQPRVSDGTHPKVLGELADVVSIILEQSQPSGAVPRDWEKGNFLKEE